MSLDNAEQPCALCGYPVNTNDTERVRYDEDGRIGVGLCPMHVRCYDDALAECEPTKECAQ